MSGKLAENVMHFARVLRGAGLPVGPSKVIDGLRALQAAGIGSREDFYWTLACVFVDRREQFEIYDQAFHIFWRDPDMLSRVMAMFMPKVEGRGMNEDAPPPPSRLAEALAPRPEEKKDDAEQEPPEESEIDAAFSVSDREVLQHTDFESMTSAEMAAAKKLIAQMRLPIPGDHHAAAAPGSARRAWSTCAPRCAQACAAAPTSSRSSAARRRAAIRRWSCCATSPGA